ncbi:DEAD/DEAH box helicase family protein [Pseudobutyrivibrio ruminis]|uniref:Type III restriction enzyme n=1 Tax=Pseudobutyrivibrio ruminis DSM 9787 TaxID=1123011 RepID=A0A285RWC8_9FIRM|nr:DEAD/DEAH box helicase family protein [Pseudobutyrivibrio ruminis]SOB96557.1 type III restriction enzyme [Pseudobutyrivibrio ruminis DSM 9787]
MGKGLNIDFDEDLIESISADFDLRKPNKEALIELVSTIAEGYDPSLIQIINMATGVGKTYLMAAFIEYLRNKGIDNVVIVTPGKTVQAKTVMNFSQGNPRYISGAQVPPEVVTPQDYSAWVSRKNGDPRLSFGRVIPSLVFIFNIQQLIAPKEMDGDTHGGAQEAIRRKPRKFDENAGILFDYLKDLDNLVVIADESHLYSTSAAAFNAALKELDPALTIGLTASVTPEDHVIFRYPLYKAIQDEYVKAPVLAFRKGGYGEDQASEEQQLRDALQLRSLKQAYYDAYTSQMNLPRLNAILFVVCADVEHATQVASLLRSPAFFGKELSVLQVDSKHDDDITEKLLENLDCSDSPVLAVVSVNKLKEGWDVKNIAVVVTLRAMASEVLTQQTMGRGLRLPFKRYTGVRQIDQLDIISHQSFRELLESENVLIQFGLEEAIAEKDDSIIKQSIESFINTQEQNGASSGNNIEESLPLYSSLGESFEKKDLSDGFASGVHEQHKEYFNNTGGNAEKAATTVIIKSVDELTSQSLEIKPVVVEKNSEFVDVSYTFPVTDIEIKQPPIDLSEITDREIEDAARRVTSTGDVLYRKEIVAALGKKLRTIDAESAEVESLEVSTEDAKEALVKIAINMQMIPKNETVIGYVENYLVPKFMKEVTFDKWTVKSLESARVQLMSLIKDYISVVQRSTKEITIIHPRKINLDSRVFPFNTEFFDPIDSSDEFVRGRLYSGWFKSLYKEESFDSYSGEYKLASLMNTSPHIVWWHRLHSYYEAYIYYTPKDRYFPDFVAKDDQGIYWIIEGKDKRGRTNDQVQNKRKAAESLVRRLAAEKDFMSQKWGYLIAYEDDIEKSDSWDDLKSLSQPVTNVV